MEPTGQTFTETFKMLSLFLLLMILAVAVLIIGKHWRPFKHFHEAFDSLTKRRTLASGFLAVAAIAVVVKWCILLFVAVPSGQTLLGNASNILQFVFTEADKAWFFYAMLLAPITLFACSAIQWEKSRDNGNMPSWYWVAASVAILLCGIVLWPAAIFAGYGAYYSRMSKSA